MALRNDKPKFESQDESDTAADVAVLEQPMSDTPAAPAAASDAPVADSPAPVQAPAPAIVTGSAAVSTNVGAKRPLALSEFKDQFEMDQFEFNTFPRLVVGLDGFTNKEGEKDLGKVIKIKLMSWSSTFVASPGTDDDEAKKQVRYSIDGKTIKGSDEDGQDIHAWVKQLKEVDGYDKAAVKEYLVIIGFLTYANGADIDGAEQGLVQLQIPPYSKSFFTRYQMEATVKIASGVWAPTDTLVCTQEKNVTGAKKFASIKFGR